MSHEALAAFLRRLAVDRQLREELTLAAGKRGLLFTPDELGKVDFEQVCKALDDAGRKSSALVDDRNDDDTDPGFGIIEVPG